MANLEKLLSLPPYDQATVPNLTKVPTNVESPEQWQLEIDILNVYEGRVPIKSFPPDYQRKIRDFYRFYGTRGSSKNPTMAKLTRDTMDNV